MNVKAYLERHRVLILALFASLLAHLFWLSAVSIVNPPRQRSVRFSSVSFLGPILGRVSPELSVRAPERSFLEKLYMAALKEMPRPYEALERRLDEHAKYLPKEDFYISGDGKMAQLVGEALDERKLEAPYKGD